MCNQSDLGCDCANPHDTRYYPERLLVFDKHPGGIGIAAQVEIAEDVLMTVRENK
jgi:DEAD/DEAH box helicase domain-containing protein